MRRIAILMVSGTLARRTRFTVHETSRLHGSMTPNRFAGFRAPYSRIPTVEQARKFGFGTWVWGSDSEEALAMREGSDEAWARMSVAKVIDRESEVYAWEQEIQEYLSNAQDYLAGN